MVAEMGFWRGTLPGRGRGYQLTQPLPNSKSFLKQGLAYCYKAPLASCHLLSKTFVGSSAGHRQWAAFCRLKFLCPSAIALPGSWSKCAFQPGCWPFYLNIPLLLPPQTFAHETPSWSADRSHPPNLGSRIILCPAPACLWISFLHTLYQDLCRRDRNCCLSSNLLFYLLNETKFSL